MGAEVGDGEGCGGVGSGVALAVGATVGGTDEGEAVGSLLELAVAVGATLELGSSEIAGDGLVAGDPHAVRIMSKDATQADRVREVIAGPSDRVIDDEGRTRAGRRHLPDVVNRRRRPA